MNAMSSPLANDQVVITLTDSDLADGAAPWRLRDLVLAGARVIIIDLSHIDQLSSTAVAAMLGAHRACKARGGGVTLRNPNRRTQDLLQRNGLMRVLDIEPASDPAGDGDG